MTNFIDTVFDAWIDFLKTGKLPDIISPEMSGAFDTITSDARLQRVLSSYVKGSASRFLASNPVGALLTNVQGVRSHTSGTPREGAALAWQRAVLIDELAATRMYAERVAEHQAEIVAARSEIAAEVRSAALPPRELLSLMLEDEALRREHAENESLLQRLARETRHIEREAAVVHDARGRAPFHVEPQ